jgi:hypothetical protein
LIDIKGIFFEVKLVQSLSSSLPLAKQMQHINATTATVRAIETMEKRVMRRELALADVRLASI